MSLPTADEIGAVFRDEAADVLATLIRVLGDFDIAEDAIQDAFVRALETWPEQGMPTHPKAWIRTVARNRAIDRLRRGRFESPAGVLPERADDEEFDRLLARLDEPIADDTLRLIFTCCHPALDLDSRVALTLSTVAGLSAAEIARSFLVSKSTLAQRLVRAKRKIKLAGVPFRVPPTELLPERVPAVLLVIYLIFNEGYGAASGGALIRHDLCGDAIRLARRVVALLPDEPDVHALLALLLLQHARRDARVDEDGNLLLLEEQNRELWDWAMIDEAKRALAIARASGVRTSYLLQAEIAEQHGLARTADETNWPAIARLYEALESIHASPVVALNHAVAILMSDGPGPALAKLDETAEPLADYVYYHATLAEALFRSKRYFEAVRAGERATQLSTNDCERELLVRRLDRYREAAGRNSP